MMVMDSMIVKFELKILMVMESHYGARILYAMPDLMEIMSIEFDKHDVLYGTGMTVYYEDPNGSPVLRIDVDTGEGTLIGYTHQTYNHGGDIIGAKLRFPNTLLQHAGCRLHGSLDNLAGLTNEAGNVVGMMPHPERVFFRNRMSDWTRDQQMGVGNAAEGYGPGKQVFDGVMEYVRRKF